MRMQSTFFVGIDVSKSKIDVAIFCSKTGDTYVVGTFSNCQEGFASMLKSLTDFLDGASLDTCFFGLEYTGNYSVKLAEFLVQKGLWLHQINPVEIKYSSGIKREKTDQLDAQNIAEYLYKNRMSLASNEPLSPVLRDLQVLFSERRAQVKQRTAAKNRRSALNQLSDSKILSEVIEELNAQIESLEAQVKYFDKAIKKLLKHPELKTNAELIQSVSGIGPVIATYFLITTHNFTRFENARQFAAYAGTAPFAYQSGSSINRAKRVNGFANKVMKALLSNAVNTVIQHDYELKLFYEKKSAEGKHQFWIFNAIKNKIIARVFAVVKRGSKYQSVDQFKKWKQAA